MSDADGRRFKVIIVGGGIGGCSAALFLQHTLGQQVDISVFEAYPAPRIGSVGEPSIAISHSGTGNEGAALGLAPNATNLFALLGSGDVAEELYASGHKSAFFEMREFDGGVLGTFPAGRELRGTSAASSAAGSWWGWITSWVWKPGRERKYGGLMIRRHDVLAALLREMKRRGLDVTYQRRVTGVEDNTDDANGMVTVRFADGASKLANLIIGADGARSVVRRSLFPSAAYNPEYTGLLGVGGFLPKSILPPEQATSLFPPVEAQFSKGAIMTFGPSAFFGFAPVDDFPIERGGKFVWWSTYEAKEEDLDREAREKAKAEVIRRHGNWCVLLSAHLDTCSTSDRFSPIPELIQATPASELLVLPNYALPRLPTWHSGRIVLLGDAAHVMPPHSGQGVAQAVEDAARLSIALKDYLGDSSSPPGEVGKLDEALEAYEKARRPRVYAATQLHLLILTIGAFREAILRHSRTAGDQKREHSAFASFVRRWSMRFFFAIFPVFLMDRFYECQFDAKDFE